MGKGNACSAKTRTAVRSAPPYVVPPFKYSTARHRLILHSRTGEIRQSKDQTPSIRYADRPAQPDGPAGRRN